MYFGLVWFCEYDIDLICGEYVFYFFGDMIYNDYNVGDGWIRMDDFCKLVGG